MQLTWDNGTTASSPVTFLKQFNISSKKTKTSTVHLDCKMFTQVSLIKQRSIDPRDMTQFELKIETTLMQFRAMKKQQQQTHSGTNFKDKQQSVHT